MDLWSLAANDGIVAAALNVAPDSSCVDVIFYRIKFTRWSETISQKVRYVVEEGRPQRLLFVPRTTQ